MAQFLKCCNNAEGIYAQVKCKLWVIPNICCGTHVRLLDGVDGGFCVGQTLRRGFPKVDVPVYCGHFAMQVIHCEQGHLHVSIYHPIQVKVIIIFSKWIDQLLCHLEGVQIVQRYSASISELSCYIL